MTKPISFSRFGMIAGNDDGIDVSPGIKISLLHEYNNLIKKLGSEEFR